MGRALTVELSESAFTALERNAQAAAQSPAQLAKQTLEREYGPVAETADSSSPKTVDAKLQAQRRFEAHFGTVDFGHATGADNDEIDADLARSYANEHERS